MVVLQNKKMYSCILYVLLGINILYSGVVRQPINQYASIWKEFNLLRKRVVPRH